MGCSNCLLYGKCEKDLCDYYFELNDEIIKADSCFSNLRGYTSCSYNGIDYVGVSFYSSCSTIEYQKEFYLTHPSIIYTLVILGSLLLLSLFVKLLRG